VNEINTGPIKTVGLIGAGRMGMPIIGHLARNGFRVLVNERDEQRRADVESRGAEWCSDLSKLSSEAQAVLICVGYDNEVRELLSINGALLKNAPSGAIIAVLSTIHPKTVEALATEARAHDVHVVDSTVCRGAWAADAGTLLSFVGGEKTVVERLRPVLSAYSSDVVHSGAIGTAQVSKAANNLILWACLIADHEALALAKRYNVNTEALRAALLTSTATNGALADWGKQSMAWAQDDLKIVGEMAEECGISLPQSGLVRELCRSLKPNRYDLDKYGA
jgi:3-hydroxyisobutyrate dehydrogenase-like beta-hydroxyacid dehydrogenase